MANKLGHSLESGKVLDRTNSIPTKDVALEDPRVPTPNAGADERIEPTDTKAGGFGGSGSPASSACGGKDEVDTGITVERRAIHFGELHHSVKRDTQNDEGNCIERFVF